RDLYRPHLAPATTLPTMTAIRSCMFHTKRVPGPPAGLGVVERSQAKTARSSLGAVPSSLISCVTLLQCVWISSPHPISAAPLKHVPHVHVVRGAVSTEDRCSMDAVLTKQQTPSVGIRVALADYAARSL